MRISELAGSAGVPASTVRYYERVGLMALPDRTASGYRDYDEDAATRLLFITRARRMGLSCEQITALIPVWAGTNCGAAHDRVALLVEEKQAEIADRVAELEQFSAQLDAVRATLEAESAAAGLPGRPHLLRPRVGGRAGRDRAQPSPLSPLALTRNGLFRSAERRCRLEVIDRGDRAAQSGVGDGLALEPA